MLDILFEDNHILVVLKPQNVPTQEDESNDECMVTIVKKYIKEKYNKTGDVYVGLVHRLDRPTGGVMVFAKTSKSASRLSEQIVNKTFSKKYVACVNGIINDNSNKLVNYLKKNPRTNTVMVVPELTNNAKYAELNYEVLERKEKVCLVRINLITGRSHQIRVQFKHIGHSIFGDVKYGGDILSKGHNLALWAYEISFIHPTTKEKMSFKVLPPEDVIPWKLFNMNILN